MTIPLSSLRTDMSIMDPLSQGETMARSERTNPKSLAGLGPWSLHQTPCPACQSVAEPAPPGPSLCSHPDRAPHGPQVMVVGFYHQHVG